MMDYDEYAMIRTRQTLLSRLRDQSDQESWQDFYDTYWKLIHAVAIQSGLNDAQAWDVVQETVISAYKKMPDFHYDRVVGSFRRWLLNLTQWRIIDEKRKRRHPERESPPGPPDRRHTATTDRIPDESELNWEVKWDREFKARLIDLAIKHVKRRTSPKQYQIFDLYVLNKWPVTKVCRALGVNAGQVYLAKYRVGRLMKKEIKNLESKLL